jgi:hypothetical protein
LWVLVGSKINESTVWCDFHNIWVLLIDDYYLGWDNKASDPDPYILVTSPEENYLLPKCPQP